MESSKYKKTTEELKLKIKSMQLTAESTENQIKLLKETLKQLFFSLLFN